VEAEEAVERDTPSAATTSAATPTITSSLITQDDWPGWLYEEVLATHKKTGGTCKVILVDQLSDYVRVKWTVRGDDTNSER